LINEAYIRRFTLIVPDSSSRALISNEEMHKIEKTSTSLSSPQLWRTSQSETNCWYGPVLSNKILRGFRVGNHLRVKSPGVASGRAEFAVPPPGLTKRANAPQLPGGGGWAQLELTDELLLNLCQHAGPPEADQLETFPANPCERTRVGAIRAGQKKKTATKRPPAPPSPLSFFLFAFTLMTSLERRIRQKTLSKLRKHAVETRSSKVLLGLLTSTRYLQSWLFTLGKPLFYHLCKAIIAELIENW